MSRCRYDCRRCNYERAYYYHDNYRDNYSCNFSLLVILILVILQFGRKEENSKQVIDNSILFIITLFYLSCFVRCR